MPEAVEDFLMSRPPTADKPLLGQTMLVVEDSRFACEAVRLLCLRSGARIRRADSLRSARRHLRTYRPSIVLVDIGLPDGSGLDLIAELNAAVPRVPVILATSGEDASAEEAAVAGADDFLPKPFTGLAEFQAKILGHLPPGALPMGPRAVPTDHVDPDILAYRDDLAQISDYLTSSSDARTIDYVTRFLAGLAKSAGDEALQDAALSLAEGRERGLPNVSTLARVAGLVQERLERPAVI